MSFSAQALLCGACAGEFLRRMPFLIQKYLSMLRRFSRARPSLTLVSRISEICKSTSEQFLNQVSTWKSSEVSFGILAIDASLKPSKTSQCSDRHLATAQKVHIFQSGWAQEVDYFSWWRCYVGSFGFSKHAYSTFCWSISSRLNVGIFESGSENFLRLLGLKYPRLRCDSSIEVMLTESP